MSDIRVTVVVCPRIGHDDAYDDADSQHDGDDHREDDRSIEPEVHNGKLVRSGDQLSTVTLGSKQTSEREGIGYVVVPTAPPTELGKHTGEPTNLTAAPVQTIAITNRIILQK